MASDERLMFLLAAQRWERGIDIRDGISRVAFDVLASLKSRELLGEKSQASRVIGPSSTPTTTGLLASPIAGREKFGRRLIGLGIASARK
jgi:hypothetical protein